MDHSSLDKQVTSSTGLHACETAQAFFKELQNTHQANDFNKGSIAGTGSQKEFSTIDFTHDRIYPPNHELPPHTIVERMEGAALNLVGKNMEGLIGMAQYLPDGELSPKKILHLAHDAGIKLDPRTAEFLQNFSSVSKHTDSQGRATFSMHGSHGLEFPMHKEVGPANVDALKTDRDISFTLGRRDGHPVMENLQGISVDTNILGMHIYAPITELAVHNDGQGVKIEAVAEPHNLLGSHKVPVEILIGSDNRMHAIGDEGREGPPPPPNPINLFRHLVHKLEN
jgi:hypothetical protein